MFKKIKSWNWPVIWSVLSPALIACVWLFVATILNSVMNLPEFDVPRHAAQMSNDTLYGVCIAFYVICMGTSIIYIWRFFRFAFSMLDKRAYKRKDV